MDNQILRRALHEKVNESGNQELKFTILLKTKKTYTIVIE